MKMSKGLEAVKEYKRNTCINCQYYYGNECNNENECFIKIIEKELKSLDIIKENPQKVVFVCNSNNYKECLEMMNAFEITFNFPKEEYDLLKEELL